jgi:hypothetical protein
MPTFPCPSCAQPLEAENTYRDWTVRCPHCAAEFVPEEVARTAFEPRDPGAEERDLAAARGYVFGPGVSLELCGWLFGFVAELGALARVLSALIQLNNPNFRNPGDAPELELTLGVMFGFLAIPFALVLIIGGRKMRDLSNRTWALGASLCAVGSFVFLYVMCVCAFLPMLFGVWGLVALANPLVRRAFEANRLDEAHPAHS